MIRICFRFFLDKQLSLLFLALILFPSIISGQKSKEAKIADKPLFRDPIYDGAADPAVIWNQKEKKWFMFYTNRRANVQGLDGVSWVHGTLIGIAESADGGATWKYRDTCDIQYRFTDYTHWAPEVIEKEPGKGADDMVIGGHPDVVVSGERAYIFYFTHPGRIPGTRPGDITDSRRSSIQVAELEYTDDQIFCNRDKPVYINMAVPER